jgi:hypothetical protein
LKGNIINVPLLQGVLLFHDFKNIGHLLFPQPADNN